MTDSAYASAKPIDVDAIPVIDIGALRGGSTTAVVEVAAQIRRASAEVGFFYVRNHGIDPGIRDTALAAARRFFALPQDIKARVAVNSQHRGFMAPGGAKMYETARADLKESFNWALDLGADDPDVLSGDKPLLGPNNWPDDDLPELRPSLYAYYEAACDCGRDLMRAFAVSLDADEAFFAPRFDRPIARGSALYYPPQPPQMGVEQFGVGAHTDYGCLTLLWQDEVGGLQVQGRDGDWVTAHPIPDTLVVNVGDLLARWSNDRFVSTPHRVVNSSGRERYSMAIFFDPNYEAVVDPADLLTPGEAAKFEPIIAGEHVKARFDAAFAYRQKPE